jgi:signal transduction histidine kinase
MPDGTQEAGGAAPAAPLLILGCEGPVAGAWEVLPDPGPQGVLLRAALFRAERRVRELRGVDPTAGQTESRQFLGHELRSPLAAIKTAVDLLQAEQGLEEGPRRMLDLAARNVARLAAAVEWSQDLLELAEDPPAPELQEIDLADLAALLATTARPVRIVGDSRASVLTDPRLLVMVVGQLERAVIAVHPEGPVERVLDSSADPVAIHLHLKTHADPRPVPGLESGATGSPLERLAHILCPDPLLAVLGLERPAGPWSSDHGGLTLVLPVPTAVPTP